ncbi:MAG: hypothetical protein BAJALOKI1v1_1250004 [Promethearchaeota archaeon]|nr:MAG: hypothetical protein BAJALOKI1v1_1250004 [Candidatus Lokiarchaeota archaeon]
MSRLDKFIDFDKKNNIVFSNLYLDREIVVKIPLNSDNGKNITIDKFDLSKYTYLISHD